MADNVDAILVEFERLKQACQDMAEKKIVVGIIGGGYFTVLQTTLLPL